MRNTTPMPPDDRMKIFTTIVMFALVLAASADDRLGSTVASGRAEAEMEFAITITSFTNGGDISKKFTCDGEDVSPQLTWSDSPKGTVTFAILVDDPDAPVGNWNHWAIWNIPGESQGLAPGISKNSRLPDGSVQGTNDFRKVGYNGPCPPAGKFHRYYFKLFALNQKLDLESTAGKKELEAAMKGHILSQREWMGRYQRSPK